MRSRSLGNMNQFPQDATIAEANAGAVMRATGCPWLISVDWLQLLRRRLAATALQAGVLRATSIRPVHPDPSETLLRRTAWRTE